MPRSDSISFNFLICCCGLSNPSNTFDQTLRVHKLQRETGQELDRILIQPSSNCNDYLETFYSFFILAETTDTFSAFFALGFSDAFLET